jgi:hypothetical protein
MADTRSLPGYIVAKTGSIIQHLKNSAKGDFLSRGWRGIIYNTAIKGTPAKNDGR